MRFVIHHLRKDLRAMWPLLVLWAGVLSLHMLVPADRMFDGTIQTARFMAIIGQLQWTLAAALSAILILQDPPNGTTAFWLTRPISPLRLLSSKALGVALLFVVVPLAFQLAGMWRSGLGGWALAAGLTEASVYVGGITLAFAALASVSSSLARFVLVLTACWLGSSIVGSALMAIAPPSPGSAGWSSMLKSQEVLRLALLPLLAVALLLHQWRTRRTYRSFAIAGVAVVLLSLMPYWPWDFLAPPARPLDGGVVVDPAPGRDDRCLESDSGVGRLGLCGRFLFSDLAAGLDLEIDRIHSRLTLTDGTSIEHRGGGRRAGWVHEQPAGGDHLHAAAGGVQDPLEGVAYQMLLEPSKDLYREYGRLPGTLEVEILLASYERRELGRLPIDQGARFRAGATAAVLDRVVISAGPPTTVDLDLQLHWAELLLSPWTWAQPVHAVLEHPTGQRSYYLSTSLSSGRGSLLALPRPRLRSTHERHSLSFRDSGGPGAPIPALSTTEEARAWLRDAEFVLRHRVRTGTYRTELRLDNFRMADYAPPEAG